MRFKPNTRKITEAGIWEASIEVDFARGKKTVFEFGRTRREAINLLRVTTAKVFKAETAYKLVPKEPKELYKKPVEFEVVYESPRYDPLSSWQENLHKSVNWDDKDEAFDDVCHLVKEWLMKIAEKEGLMVRLPDK